MGISITDAPCNNYSSKIRNMYTETRTDEVDFTNPLEVITNVDDIKEEQQLPDARKHQIISFIKSGIRLLGYVLIPFNLTAAVVVLVISEVVGIIEELV